MVKTMAFTVKSVMAVLKSSDIILFKKPSECCLISGRIQVGPNTQRETKRRK
jgi:hypothetical protein